MSSNTYVSKGTVGVIRQRTNKFMEYRKKYLEETSSLKFETGSSLNDNGKTSLLGKKSEGKSSKSTSTELTAINKNENSSRYIDIFNSTNVLYEELRQNFVVLQQEQQKRIIPKFDDDENRRIDKRIKELIIEMTRKVRQADENINLLSRMRLNTSSEESVKENMKLNLASKIKEFSRDFKLNEEKYMANYQELVGDTNRYEIEDLDGSTNKNAKNKSGDNFLQLTADKSTLILQQRDDEISTLLNSITELASVFKDLQSLVQHQGTILDRIDYNIDQAKDNIVNANKELVKTEKMMKTNCYRNAMLVVIIAIFVMALMLVLKFTK